MRAATRLYAVAIFLSSFLLFLIEPMAGKRLLPLLGGSAAVWATCLVFFQLALLLGYLSAHALVTRTGARGQAAVYVALLVLSLVQLVVSLETGLHADPSHPIVSVLWLLTLLIAVPFVTLSVTSPLLQAWYARSATAAQPYRLYAVSNVGSLLALVVYPWLIEPRFSLADQQAGLIAGCALLAATSVAIALSMRAIPAAAIPEIPVTATARAADIPMRDRILWISLAACGSLLLSAVTNHLSQNVATIPLLWIVPLIVYLLSFVVAFSSGRWHPRWLVLVLAPAALAAPAYLLYKGELQVPVVVTVATFCSALFVLCLMCHSELYRRRPAPQHLTVFYFFLAAGGALGAFLVGVVAPTMLTGEYELACGLVLAAALGLVVTWANGWFPRVFWFAAIGAMITLLASEVRNDRVNALLRVRNFYGTLVVTQTHDRPDHAAVRTLFHGVIQHGQQIFRTDLATTPTTYYSRASGVGLSVDLCCGDRPRRIGVIGLGTGTMAAYGRAGDVIRFYELNPAVERIARNFFTYIRDSPARIEIVNGDARLSLAAEAPQRYDVLVVDAFSGDAIPVHLLTTQAIDLYRRHLAPGGILAVHVSNRYLDLAPVVEQLARHAWLKTAFISSADDPDVDAYTSDWVLVTTNENFLSQPQIVKERQAIAIPPSLHRWTDDYNSLLPLLRTHPGGDDSK